MAAQAAPVEVVPADRRLGAGSFLGALLRHPGAMIGLALVALLLVAAAFADQLAPFPPTRMAAGRRLAEPS